MGQLLPISIMAEGALMVPTISRAAQDDYRQDVWLYGGLNQVESVSIEYKLGDSVTNQDIAIDKSTVVLLNPTLVTKKVYRDRSDVMVSFQAEGGNFERVNLNRTEVFVSIESPVSGLDPAIGSCFTNQYTGSVCVATVTLPDNWFDYNEDDVKLEALVMYGLSLDDLEELQNVTLETRVDCSNVASSAENESKCCIKCILSH